MNAREAIKLNLNSSNMICQGYLADLTDADLLVRPVPGANHIAWQLGHLLISEHDMVVTSLGRHVENMGVEDQDNMVEELIAEGMDEAVHEQMLASRAEDAAELADDEADDE